MKRRAFLGSAAAFGAGGVAAPAIAQSAPQIRWRMTSTFPKALDITYGAGEMFCRYVSDLTDGKFVIQQFAAGEIVPGFQVLDATQNGTVEAGYTGLLFNIGKSPIFPLTASAPFLMNPRAQNAWYYHADGLAMTNAFLRDYNIVGYPCGNTGMQWGGWFKKEIRTVEDLKGLKMRIAGLAGVIAARVGVVPQQIAPGDIYPALERGTIDAVEYIGPYDDEKLGFQKIVQRYYAPGWQEGGTIFHAIFNLPKYEELPALYKKAIEVASKAVTLDMLAHYDQKNPEAMMRLVAHCRAILARSTFCLVGTHGSGGADVSPRGDPPGFVRVLDDAHILVPDRIGNNRFDSDRAGLQDVGVAASSSSYRAWARRCASTAPPGSRTTPPSSRRQS